jgi:hypothetical protein
MGISTLFVLVMNCNKYNCISLSLCSFLSLSLFLLVLHIVTTTIPAGCPEIKRSLFFFSPSLLLYGSMIGVYTDAVADGASFFAYVSIMTMCLTRLWICIYNIQRLYWWTFKAMVMNMLVLLKCWLYWQKAKQRSIIIAIEENIHPLKK